MPEGSPHQLQRLEEENAELKRAVDELSTLNELGRMIGGVTELEEVLNRIVHSAVKSVGAGQGAIFLVEDDAEDVSRMNTLVRALPESAIGTTGFRLSQSLLGWMELYVKPIIVNDPPNDERFRGVQWDESLTSVLAVPMLIRSRLVATLVLFNKKGAEGFGPDDQRLLSIIAAQSAQVLDNARLRTKEGELLRIRHEMETASTIQKNLLPSHAPEIEGYEVAGRTTQLDLVGGDFFDFIPCSEDRWMICLGDVSGKGLPASLLMSNVNAVLKTQVAHNPSPREALEVANDILHHSTTIDKFVTLAACQIGPHTPEVIYANAGHNKPIVVGADGSTRVLPEQGIMLGLTGKCRFEEGRLTLNPGELLAIYSDGITESVNSEGEEFGEERLASEIARLRRQPAEEIIETIFRTVAEYIGDLPRGDDISLVVVKRR